MAVELCTLRGIKWNLPPPPFPALTSFDVPAGPGGKGGKGWILGKLSCCAEPTVFWTYPMPGALARTLCGEAEMSGDAEPNPSDPLVHTKL